jgi:hypothetical protein
MVGQPKVNIGTPTEKNCSKRNAALEHIELFFLIRYAVASINRLVAKS